jgi:hypothetical protein
MGTNYYLHKESTSKCVTCKHDPHSEVLHIGKSSFGWCFSLHIIPERGINSLEDWITEWGKPGTKILNEYDEEVLPEDMIKIITTRGPGRWCPEGSELQRHAPYHKDNPGTVREGPGSYDLIIGEFS